MSPADAVITPIRTAENPPTFLDHAIHTCGQRLRDFRSHRIVGEPDKGDAQSRVRDLLDLSRIVDEMFLAFGRDCRSEFGHLIDLREFTDVTRCAVEGNATHVICAAMEATIEDYRDAPYFLQAAE